MKPKKSAFTLVELLVVMGIIAILVALLIPALMTVKTMAKETQQKAQLTTIEMGLTAFKNDYGDYPPSDLTLDGVPSLSGDYCGVQKLAEALVGWDLLGFHPKSAWRADGKDSVGGDTTYDPTKNRDSNPNDGVPDTLKERTGVYLDIATANVFRLGISAAGKKDGVFDAIDPGGLEGDRVVICDSFGVKSINIGTKTVKAGTPILYYKANISSKTIDYTTFAYDQLIYNQQDNDHFVYNVKELADQAKYPSHPTPVNPLADNAIFFYGDYIADPKVSTATMKWPYRPDSYILISAGPDGLYGTNDDIRNF